jgi:hypothetical protein
MFIRKSVHTAAMAKLAKANVDLEQDAQRERETAGRLIQRNRELQTQLLAARAEAEANKVDAERYRAKLKRDREYHADRRKQPADGAYKFLKETAGHAQ